MKLSVIFEDSELIVINKPAGLISTPSETQTEETLADILNKEYGVTLERGGLVHRLDKDTSGIILAAKTQESFDNLQAQFKGREVQKEYLALVHGKVDKDGIVEGSIVRNPENREKFTVDESGKEAVTEYQINSKLKMFDSEIKNVFEDLNKIQLRKLYTTNYPEFTLLNCFPKTGRTHQIRVHLKHINHPIVGDEKYGGRKTVRLDHRWCHRQFLHAKSITFSHPKTGERMTLSCSLPEDLSDALSHLSKEI